MELIGKTPKYRCSFDKDQLERYGDEFHCPTCKSIYTYHGPTSAIVVMPSATGFTSGYYFFPWNVQQDDAPPPPPPTNTLEVLKLNEEAVEKVLADMPKIQKLIIYRQLYAEGVRMEGIDRAIVKEAKEQLKAIKAATP